MSPQRNVSFPQLYKLIDKNCTESDIISNLKDKAALKEAWNSNLDGISYPVDEARVSKNFRVKSEWKL